MSQLLALEWNGSEARLVVAASHGEKVVIEQAFSVTLRPGQPGEDREEVDAGGRIAAALAARGISRIDTLVAVGRANVELRQLSLPPAPEEELPELVRFQAIREFNELTDDWLLDFVPIDRPAEGPQTVLAAAIDPKLVAQIEHTCETADLKPRRLILRPCAAASLLGRGRAARPEQPKLLVDLLSDEADLTVVIGRKVIYMRTARLGGDPLQQPDAAQALLAEIRRTVAAARNQLGGQPVESIVLCGRDEQHAELAKSIQKDLGTPTELFDPFAGLNLGRDLRVALPDHPGRFAPLLGMALAELERTGHAIDFLHPRGRAEPRSWRKVAALAIVGSAVLMALVFSVTWWQVKRLDKEIAKLDGESESLDKKVGRGEDLIKGAAEIEKWTANDIVWLDHLHCLSRKFPCARDAMLTGLQLASSASGGQMRLDGLARTNANITEMAQGLKDEYRVVVGDRDNDETLHNFYFWRFDGWRLLSPVTSWMGGDR